MGVLEEADRSVAVVRFLHGEKMRFPLAELRNPMVFRLY